MKDSDLLQIFQSKKKKIVKKVEKPFLLEDNMMGKLSFELMSFL